MPRPRAVGFRMREPGIVGIEVLADIVHNEWDVASGN